VAIHVVQLNVVGGAGAGDRVGNGGHAPGQGVELDFVAAFFVRDSDL
jgi:hypothetical protein